MARSVVAFVVAVCLVALVVAVEPTAAANNDTCSSDTGFSGAQLSVLCYSGNFLVKMLTELNSGNQKTAEHVRVHLLPYLGSMPAINALYTDQPSDPNCTVCYTDPQTAMDLEGLRANLTPQQLQAYDSLGVCYARLTTLVMSLLPTSGDGMYLVPSRLYANDAYTQVIAMFKSIYADPYLGANVCPKSFAA